MLHECVRVLRPGGYLFLHDRSGSASNMCGVIPTINIQGPVFCQVDQRAGSR